MKKVGIETRKKQEVVDITESVAESLEETGRRNGVMHLFLLHTTAALTTADLDPGTDQDLLDALRELVPKLRFRHPHDPKHVPDHILSALIGTSLCIPIADGKPLLGTWQRIVLVEFDGPRQRQVVMSLMSQGV